MRFTTRKSPFLYLFFISILSLNAYTQHGNITVIQDSKFEQLLNEKRKINSTITLNDRYKIQIYNGENETAKKMLTEFRRDYKNFDSTIVFSTPTYKVWVGNFKSRIEAERNLTELRKTYPNAFLVKPNT